MNIGLVSAYDVSSPGGVASHVRQMANFYGSRGHRVKILGPCPPTLSSGLDDRFIPLGRPVSVPAAGSIARLSLSIWLAPKIRLQLKREAFDVLHVHEPLAPALPWCSLEVSRTVNVGTFHAFSESDTYYRIARPMLRRWFNRLHGRVACSPASLEYASRHFSGDYRLIPDGIDLDLFSPLVAPLPDLQDGRVNLLFVGRLEKRKGLRYLLAAYDLVRDTFPNTRLIVVGAGQLDAPSAHLIRQDHRHGQVVLTGYVPDELLPRYYRSADLFCSPAIGNESLGIVLLEAMASSKAVIATAINGYSSVVTSGKEGLLVPPGNPEKLAVALAELIRNRELREQMGERARESARAYSWETVGPMMLDFYRMASASRPRAESAT